MAILESTYEFLSPRLRKLLDLTRPTVDAKAQERQQFIESYQPQKNVLGRGKEDILQLLTSIPRIGGAFARSIYETDIMKKAGYDVDKSFWSQAFKRTPFTLKQRMGILGTTLMPDVLPKSVYEKMDIPYSPRRDMFRKLYLDSLTKQTGKWVYNPEAKGRKWLPSPKEETSRWKDYYKHPFLAPFEDIMNVVIPMQIAGKAPIGMLSKTAAGKAIAKTKIPTVIRKTKFELGEKAKAANIISEMKGSTYRNLKRLRMGKLKASLEAVPKAKQLELEALLTRKASPWKLTKELDTAYKIAEKSATVETKSLIARGLLSAGKHRGGVWKDLTKEFGKSIDDLEKLGIKEPVYYPHTFTDHAARVFPTLRKRTPSYFKTKTGVKGWEEPYISIPKHKGELYAQKASLKALGQFEKTFGKKIVKGEGLLPGFVEWKPKGYFEFFKVTGKKLVGVKRAKAKLQIPKFIDDSIKQTFAAPGAVENFFRMTWDPLTNTWKMSVLALSPRWIFNNTVGNAMLNLAGAVGPKGYIDAIKAFAKAKKAVKTQGITFERAMMRQHVPAKAWQMGIYGGEAGGAIAGAKRGLGIPADKARVTTAWQRLGYKLSEVPNAMYRVNSGVEAFFRTAHYLDKIGKPGFNPAKAIASVNEFLFDYGAMGTFEKAFIRRIDPFWAWHKNIIRLTATYPIKHPIRAALLQKAESLIEDDKRDYRFLPEYLRSYMEIENPFTGQPIKIGGEQGFLSTRGMNPFADIFTGLSALNPMLKIPIERTTGVELFKGKPFTSPYKAWGSTEKVVPPIWKHIISQFPHAKLIETAFKPYATYSTGEPVLDKEGQIKYQKSRLLELLKMFGINITSYDLDQMYEQGISGAMREQTARESYEKKLEMYRNR